MKQKYFLLLPIVILFIGSAFFFAQYTGVPKVAEPVEVLDATAAPAAVSFSVVATQDGQSALDLLKNSAQVEYTEFDFGVMVTQINGVAADDKHYWALYVNDAYATAGASETILKTGDTIKWMYEEISQAPL